jgi:predicted tellurium resistance membrane protein TerC
MISVVFIILFIIIEIIAFDISKNSINVDFITVSGFLWIGIFIIIGIISLIVLLFKNRAREKRRQKRKKHISY